MYDSIMLKDKLGNPLKNHHHVTLKQPFLDDCKIWEKFLSLASQKVQCLNLPFVDIDAFTYADELGFFTDASLNSSFGMGAVYGNRWLVMTWGKQFIEQYQPSIEYLELFALTAGILTWSKYLKNCRIIIFCDNEAVVHMVNNMTSHCKQCMKLIRLLVLDGLVMNRRVFVRHICLEFNILADALSRQQFQRFWIML